MAIFQTAINGRKHIAENTLEVSFERPKGFVFRAGQYIQMSVPKLLYPDTTGTSRVFSIASSPLDNENISVAFRETGSGFKRTLKELPMSAPVNIEGPHGFFTLPQNADGPIVFVAGGIGITPFMSMIRFAAEKQFVLPITLLYGNESEDRTAYLKELQDAADSDKQFVLKNVFGKIDEEFIRQNVENIKNCTWYIAGPPAMVDHVRNILFLLGVDANEMHYESFTGYGVI